jgi:hypothetical protein
MHAIALSNGFFFSLSARLARYTGNKTYADWADKTWDWADKIGLIDDNYAVYTGANVQQDCKSLSKLEFTADNAIFVLGSSYMYNYVCYLSCLVIHHAHFPWDKMILTFVLDKWRCQVANSDNQTH